LSRSATFVLHLDAKSIIGGAPLLVGYALEAYPMAADNVRADANGERCSVTQRRTSMSNGRVRRFNPWENQLRKVPETRAKFAVRSPNFSPYWSDSLEFQLPIRGIVNIPATFKRR
jgi:hypothetical protein